MAQGMQIVRREAIPTLRTVNIDDVEHNLGILKDFRAHPALAAFLPPDARLAMSWVRLEPNERLETHVHPIESMIVVANGEGRTLGDLEAPFSDGDVILIPRGCHHGFVGAGDWGFWALSVQFEARGLYEDPAHALVRFLGDTSVPEAIGEPSLEMLLEQSRLHCEAHRRNPIFALLQSGRLDDPQRRFRLLDAVQTWSNWFQRVIQARAAFTEDPRFAPLAQQHLAEERGHNAQLATDRGGRADVPWDPLLEAMASWFAWKMVTLDAAEKTVLIHLVLEAAGATFHAFAQPIMARYGETEYFALHGVDDEHEAMAREHLTGLAPENYRRLLRVHKEGWDVFNALCARMAALADEPQG
jgi:quercetin dioxygenase-like cupin family protein